MRPFDARALRNLGNRITVSIRPDNDGFIGRECPNRDCKEYFKITPGTVNRLEPHQFLCGFRMSFRGGRCRDNTHLPEGIVHGTCLLRPDCPETPVGFRS